MPGHRRAREVVSSGPWRANGLYLWLDATYLKVRKGGRVVSVAAIIASGVNQDGGGKFGLGPSDPEARLLGGLPPHRLRQRGEWCPVDHFHAHEGAGPRSAKSLRLVGNGAEYISLRNLLACAQDQPVTRRYLCAIFVQPDAASAQVAWRQVADQLRPRFPKPPP